MLFKLFCKTFCFFWMCMSISAISQATTINDKDFALLLLMKSTSSSTSPTSTYVINYYDTINDKEYDTKADQECIKFLKEMFKFFPPSNKMDTCETWFQRNHCQFKKNNKDKQVKIVYVNRLSTWNILEKSLSKETIPLTPVFLGLWLYESSTKHAIGSYFDAQRKWLNTQGEDLEKTSESLTKSINSIQTPLNKLNIIGMGLLIIAGIAIIFYVIMQILMMRSKGRVIPKKADELVEDPVHPDESPLEKTGIYILEQINEQLETVVKTAEQRIIEQMETSHQPFEAQFQELIKMSKDNQATIDECLRLGEDNNPGLPILNKNIIKIYNLLQKNSSSDTVNTKSKKRDYGF